jgi:hypothetical protein
MESLLAALEARARDDGTGDGVIDPHIAAFIACLGRDMEEGVIELDRCKLNPPAFAAATLRLLGSLQKRFRVKKLSHLARQLSEPVRKSIGQLHSRTFQRQVGARLEYLVGLGDLTRLAGELNIAGIRAQDDRKFRAAQYQFSMLKRECRKLEKPMMPSDPAALQLGYLGSACFSVAVLLATAVYLLLHSFHRWA